MAVSNIYSKFLFPNRAIIWFSSPAWKDTQADGHLFPLYVRICSVVSLSPVCLPRIFVLTFSALYSSLWLVCRLILSLAFRIMCVMCLSEGPFLFLCVNFCFPVLCHLWSTLLPNGQQEEKSHKCTPEAVLSSPQLGHSAPLFPCWRSIKPQAS